MAKTKKNQKKVNRIIIKFSDAVNIPPVAENNTGNQFITDKLIPSWKKIEKSFPGIVLGKLFSTIPYQRINELIKKGKELDPNYQPSKLHNFYWIDCPLTIDTTKLMSVLAKTGTIEMLYEQGESTPSGVINGTGNPRFVAQNYLDPSPAGIDARFAWKKQGGDGQGMIRFIDIEQGWFLNHEDFPAIGSQSEITLLSGVNKQYKGHGTAVLGIVLAQDNDMGGVGITPRVKADVISHWRSDDDDTTNDADAIIYATDKLSAGDVLLIEIQTKRIIQMNEIVLPVETDPAVFEAISLGVANGITIIESAANGNIDLDEYKFSIKRGEPKSFFLRRGDDNVLQDPAFKDSGAILVGAATSKVPHERLISDDLSSNYGSRVDCYAWGEEINTSGNNGVGGPTLYTSRFGGTSGASAIIAGAAIAIQSMVMAVRPRPFTPRQLRRILSDAITGTKSNDPAVDKIGVMPDLKQIFENVIQAGL